MTELRLIGGIDDFIFIKSQKVILPLKKAEKIIKVKATPKRKAHKRRITFEGKGEEDKIKSSLDPDNLVDIKLLGDSGIPGLMGGMHEGETYICKFKDGSSSIHKTMDEVDIIGEIGTYQT